RLEHVEGDRGEDHRLHRRGQQEEARRREHLHVHHEPGAEDAEHQTQKTSSVACRRLWVSKNRRSAYPARPYATPTASSASTRPPTSPRDAPSAICRAAFR